MRRAGRKSRADRGGTGPAPEGHHADFRARRANPRRNGRPWLRNGLRRGNLRRCRDPRNTRSLRRRHGAGPCGPDRGDGRRSSWTALRVGTRSRGRPCGRSPSRASPRGEERGRHQKGKPGTRIRDWSLAAKEGQRSAVPQECPAAKVRRIRPGSRSAWLDRKCGTALHTRRRTSRAGRLARNARSRLRSRASFPQ